MQPKTKIRKLTKKCKLKQKNKSRPATTGQRLAFEKNSNNSSVLNHHFSFKLVSRSDYCPVSKLAKRVVKWSGEQQMWMCVCGQWSSEEDLIWIYAWLLVIDHHCWSTSSSSCAVHMCWARPADDDDDDDDGDCGDDHERRPFSALEALSHHQSADEPQPLCITTGDILLFLFCAVLQASNLAHLTSQKHLNCSIAGFWSFLFCFFVK